MKQRHLRTDDHLGDAMTLVARGGELDPVLLRRDARRCKDVYGHFGISVFAARDLSVDELAQVSPLVRFSVLTLFQVGALRAAGLALWPTGRNRRHFTVVLRHLDEGVRALLLCPRREWPNPYYEG